MSDGMPSEDRDDSYTREAFMEAIVKLADDAAFRESFLTHYQLWLHPPMVVTEGSDISKINFAPGAIIYLNEEVPQLTEEQMVALRKHVVTNFAEMNGRLRELKETS